MHQFRRLLQLRIIVDLWRKMKGLLITGFWNSGTTLLVDLLRKHPQLQLARGRWLPNLEERSTRKWLQDGFIDLGRGYEPILEGGWEAHQEPQLSEQEIRRFRKKFGRAFFTWPGRQLLAKNPWWFFIPSLLRQVFQDDDIRYLIVFREGVHQVVSKDYWKHGAYPPDEMLLRRAHFWAMCIDYYEQHWHGRSEVLTLSYKHICKDPRENMQSICHHAGLDATPIFAKIPEQLSNRMKLWDQLDPSLQEQVKTIVTPAQLKLDQLILS